MAKSEIVKQLARGKVDTEIALKQLKLLLAEFPDERISSWVNRELTGYKTKDELPPYRKAAGTLRGSILNYTVKASNVGIPLSPDAPKDLYTFCNIVEFRESIGALKKLIEREESGSLGVNVPSDYYPYIIKYSLMTMTAILGAQVQVSSTAIPHIFSEVDNRLLDVFLLLEKEFGNLDDLDIDLSGKTDEQIEDIHKQINVFIYNDNSITIGDENEISDSIIASDSEIEE